MRRFHLLEIAEQPWCPRVIRDGVTDYLRWAVDAGRAYDDAAPVLAEILKRASDREIVDLCAGGGGPWRTLRAKLGEHGCDVRVRLTDRYPNHRAFAQAALESDGAVTGEIRPVDATDVPDDLRGVRTIFSAFHHFERDAAKEILRDAAARGEPIAIFEANTSQWQGDCNHPTDSLARPAVDSGHSPVQSDTSALHVRDPTHSVRGAL
jgi:hypothetical protein